MPNKNFTKSIDILIYDYELRKQRNARYSKRAYAKQLEMSSGRLVDLFKGKCNLSIKAAQKISERLSVDPELKDLFVVLIENETQARPDNRKTTTTKNSRRLQINEFAIISDWEYFAFMALVETAAFKSNIPWIADKLGLTKKRTEEVIHHLQDQGFITITDEGKISNVHNSLSTLTDIPSDVLKKANIECIQQGIEKVYSVDVNNRDVTSLTFPVALGKMKELKSLIREFKLKAAALMDDQPTSEVYNLNIQLVPVTNLNATHN